MALHPHRYLELIQADAARMEALAPPALHRPVPSCPGWDVAEVIRHTAGVYASKVATLRLGRRPEPGEWRAEPPQGDQLVAWFRSTLKALLDELIEHDPDDAAWSWWPPDQTVGFWYRRMALETVVHRVDVEMAVNQVTPVDEALAADGVDEVLTVFLTTRGQREPAARTGAVGVATGERRWSVHLDSDGVRVDEDAADGLPARLRGPAGRLLLYLWGRGSLVGLDVDGDTDLVFELRRRLAAATR